MIDLNSLVRPNIRALQPYQSARGAVYDSTAILLDANENPFDTGYNRYPDPYQTSLKETIAEIKGINPEQIFIGNGSDEAIDLLVRAFCEPGKDRVYFFPPTFGMYRVVARLNNVEVVEIPLVEDFDLPDIRQISRQLTSPGIIFLCSPNNPTGNLINLQRISEIAGLFNGLVVVDEAYIDFAAAPSALSRLAASPNLVVLQTLSKAYGMAGLRVGLAFAHRQVIEVLNKIKYPYNVNALSQHLALKLLVDQEGRQAQTDLIIREREKLRQALLQLPFVRQVYPSAANFLLVRWQDAPAIHSRLRQAGILVRQMAAPLADCLRVTVGTPQQNELLLKTLKER